MRQLSPTHIENCSREISRWAKAVRLINAFERGLSKDFPEPDLIEPERNPFDLRVIWEADNPGHSDNLRKRIVEACDEVELNWDRSIRPWHPEGNGYFGLRGRFRLGKKTTMYLRLLVADGLNKTSMIR